MDLAVITACIRPQNLPAIHESLGSVPVHWIVVVDLMKSAFGPVKTFVVGLDSPHKITLLSVLQDEKDHSGGYVAKNRGLDHVENTSKERYTYILDDDNIMHPDFMRELAPFISKDDSPDLICFGQDLCTGWHRLGPPMIIGIDQAQYVVKTSRIWGLRLPEAYVGDGVFAEILTRFGRTSFILDKTLSYYNKLSNGKAPSDIPKTRDVRWLPEGTTY